MNNVVNELTRSVVDKNSLQECSVNELQELTRQYPYFGPAQFLLARKLKEENSPLYEQQSQKAILFFQDQLWYDYLSGNNDVTVKVTAGAYEPAVQKAVPAVTEEKFITDTPPPVTEPLVTKEPEEEEPVIGEPIIEEKIEEQQQPNQLLEEPITEEPVIEQKQPEPQPLVETIAVAAPERIIDPISGQDLTDTEEEEENQQTQEIPASEPAIKLPEFKITAVDTSIPLSFEPYHTVDYFASQGIKAKEESKPKDKFSQQLKSFTEWL
jgi:hypothetical protein